MPNRGERRRDKFELIKMWNRNEINLSKNMGDIIFKRMFDSVEEMIEHAIKNVISNFISDYSIPVDQREQAGLAIRWVWQCRWALHMQKGQTSSSGGFVDASIVFLNLFRKETLDSLSEDFRNQRSQSEIQVTHLPYSVTRKKYSVRRKKLYAG